MLVRTHVLNVNYKRTGIGALFMFYRRFRHGKSYINDINPIKDYNSR